MNAVFDREELLSLLRDFHTLTGLRAVVFDACGIDILSYPEQLPHFCRLIRRTPESKAAPSPKQSFLYYKAWGRAAKEILGHFIGFLFKYFSLQIRPYTQQAAGSVLFLLSAGGQAAFISNAPAVSGNVLQAQKNAAPAGAALCAQTMVTCCGRNGD